MILAVVLSLVLLTLSLAAASDPLHIPLSRRKPSVLNLDNPPNAGDRLRKRFTTSVLDKRQGSSGIPLIDLHADYSYIATVSVGTPAQILYVYLGTGSSDFWLVSTGCSTCPDLTLFNPSGSTSFRTTSGPSGEVNITYGGGWAFGQNSSDTLTMGSFTAFEQGFLTVTALSRGFVSIPVSGIMGFGFQAISSSGALPFWLALYNSHKLSSPLFSFWLTRYINVNPAQDLEPGGILTLGGTNSSLYTGDIEYIDIPAGVNATYWLLTITGFTMNGNTIPITPATSLSAFDVGSTLIGGPTEDVTRIWAAVPGSRALTGVNAGFFSVPCMATLQVTVSFGGRAWPVNSADMILTASAGSCVGAIFDLSLGSSIQAGRSGYPRWVIGDAFLKNVYSVFRLTPPAIGFAQLSPAAGGPAISPSTTIPTPTISPTPTNPLSSGTLSIKSDSPFLAAIMLLLATCLSLV